MWSIGASFADIYVQRNQYMEKVKRLEEERARSVGERGGVIIGSCKREKSKKIHPTGGFQPSDPVGSKGEKMDCKG
ncbi:hypothetical protein ACSBR2_009144 [Camellia fascicularis]